MTAEIVHMKLKDRLDPAIVPLIKELLEVAQKTKADDK